MEDYSAGIQSFKQQFNLDDPPDNYTQEGEEDYSAGIEAFKQQFNLGAAPAVAPEIVEEEPAYPPQLAKTALPDNRIISGEPTQIIPSNLESALGWTQPKPALPEPIPFNLASGAVQLPAEQPIQEEPQILTELLPSLKSGYERTKANVLNWLPDLAQYREENPWVDLAEKVVGIGGGLIPPRPISDEDKARMRAEAQKGYRKSLEEGRPLQFSEINELKDYRSYMYGLIGSSAPQMVGSILSLGTMTPLLLSAEMNEGMKDIEGLTLEEKIPLVKAGGLIAAAFENIGLGVLFRGIPKEVLAKVGMGKIVGIMEKSLAKRIAGRGIATSLTEAGTETLQDGTFMIGEYIAGKDFKPGEVLHRLRESAIGGGLLGGHIGMGVKGIQETGKGVEAIGKPILPEDALENPFAKSLERQLFDALDTGIIPGFQKIEPPKIDTRPPLFEGEAGPAITPGTSVLETESTPPVKVSPTEVQGPPPGPPALPPIKVHKDVKSFAAFLTNNIDDLESYLEGEETTFEGWIKKHAEGSPEEVRKFADSFTPEVMEQLVDEESFDFNNWINKRAEEFTKPPDIKTPEWQDYKNPAGKTLAQTKKIGDTKRGDDIHPVVVRKNKDGIFRVAEFWGSELLNLSPSQLFTNAYGGFDNVPSGLLNKFATEAEATEAAKTFIGEPVLEKPEVSPPPFDEHGYRYIGETDEEGQAHGQGVMEFDPERKSPMTRDVDPKVLLVRYEGEFRYGSLWDGKAYNAAGELRETRVKGEVVKVKPDVKPKTPEVKPKPPEERVFKPLVDEKGKPESQAVIKALTVREGREDIVSDMFHLTIDIHKASGKKVAKVLKDRGLITEEIQHPQLTPKGRELALQIKENEELVDEGLPMEYYTPKKGVTVKTLKGSRGIVANIEGKEWDGSPVYSNGIWALKGKVPEGITPVTKVDFTPIIEGTPTESKTTPAVDPIAFSQVPGDEKIQVHFAPNDPSLTAETVTIDGKQYDLIKKLVPDAKFVVAESPMRPIAIYSGDERVGMVKTGIIMPTRNEGGPARQPGITAILRKYQDEKKGKPAEEKPKAKPKAKKKPPVVVKPPVKEAPEMVEPEPVSSSPQNREDLEKLLASPLRKGELSPADLDAMLEPDVWKGLEEGKPTRLKVFHGEGKRAQYAEGVEGAALGKGRYSALKESDAKDFGDVTPLTVELENPAVLTSDEDLAKWFDKAIPFENEERVHLLKLTRVRMVSQGNTHDGVIINIPKMADVNEKGKTVKRLREIFDVSQVIEFKPKAEPKVESVSDLEPTVKERQRIQKGTGYRLTTEEFETLEQEYKTEGFREKKEKAFSEATTREERERFFNEVAWLQRGYPEKQMRVIQLIAGGGPLSMAVEHGGDLINRMAKIFHDGGYEYAEDKIWKVHNVVTQGYGFEKESLENLEWMAKESHKKPFDEVLENLKVELKKFAEEHKKLPAYNEAHRMFRDFNVAIGEWRFNDAKKIIIELKNKVDEGPKAWNKWALEGLEPAVEEKAEAVEVVESKKKKPKDTKSQSIRELVYTDLADAVFPLASTLSIDEKIGILRQYKPQRLAREFRKMVEKKYGFKWVKRTTEGIDITIDNMMDAYSNIEGMAAVLGLPLKAIGQDGSLGLQTEPPAKPKRGFVTGAYYQPGGKFISIHEKTRAFAHEWMHALDYHILEKLGQGTVWDRGMSGRLRGKEKKDFDENVIDPWNAETTTDMIAFAFGDLLNAVFFDDAQLAAEIMQLQEKLSKATSEASITSLENQIDKLRKGMTQKHFEKSSYFQGSLSEEFKSKPYYTTPTELLARAFEAYVAHRVELQEQTAEYPGTEYITMPDWAYSAKMLHNPEITHNMELVYPKDGDRTAIFEAFDVLFDTLKKDLFEGEAAVAKPSRVLELSNLHGLDTKDRRLFSKEAAIDAHRRIEGEKTEFRRQTERQEKVDPFKERGKPQRAWIAFENNIANQGLASKTASLLNMLERYKDNKDVNYALIEILRRLTDDPGGGILFTKSSDNFIGNYTERTRSLIRSHLAIFKNMVDESQAASWTEEQHRDLRLLMTSDPATLSAAEEGRIDKKVTELAGKLRVHLTKVFKYGKEFAGITFLEENAYLPRMLDAALIAVDPQKFIEQSEKMFKESLWPREFGNSNAFMNEVNAGQHELVMKLGKITHSKGMKFRRQDPAFQSQYADFLKLYKDLKRLDKELKKANEGEQFEGDPENEIRDLIAENAEMLEIVYDEIGTIWAEEGSKDWKERIDLQQSDDPAYASPFSSDFTKQRKFPASADTYMAEFYQPALESIAAYTQAVIKKTEFEKRFSSEYIKQHESGPWMKKHATKGRDGGGPPRNYLDFLMDEFIAKQIPADDVKFIRYNINAILGRVPAPERSSYRLVNKLHSFALMAMLGKAALTSFPEALMVGIKTGSGMKGLEAFALTLQEFGQYFYLPKDAKQSVQLRNQLANIFGIVDAAGMADIAIERLGGLMVDDPKVNMRVSKWFKYTGLVGLTNAQRRSVMAIAFQYFKEMANQYREPVGNNQAAKVRNAAEARRIFLEFGVPQGRVDEFVDWFLPVMEGKKLPDTSDILDRYGEMGEMQEVLNVALNRMVNYSIQDPDIAAAPRFAEHPLGRLTYSIMRFSYSVHKNVIKATYRDFKRVGKSEGWEGQTTGEKIKGISEGKLRQAQLASKLAGPVLSLYIAHLLVTTGREFLGNKERWDRWEKEDKLAPNLFELAFYRTGLLGALDPVFQFWRSMRWEWHWSKLTVGATGGYYADNAKTILDVFRSNQNSPNTTTAEARGLKSAYRLFINPLIIAVMTNPATFGAFGPLAPAAKGVAGIAGTSHSAQSWFSTMLLKLLYDEKKEKGAGAKAFRKARGIRKGRKGRKGRGG